MSRYIDVRPDEEGMPSELVIVVGDVVRFAATGGRIRSGAAVELLGAPGTVLIRARSPGLAVVDVLSGDPFRAPVTRGVVVRVEP